MLPFTHAQFLEVFARYNTAIWPAQLLVYLMAGAMMVALAAHRWRHGDRFIVAALALMWLHTGLAYHWIFFTRINPAAWLFGAFFIAQGLLLCRAAFTGEVRFGAHRPRARTTLGWVLIAYAAIVYPWIGLATAPGYPWVPLFGITPCPLTLFTFGLLLLATSRVPWHIVLIPVLWSLVGGSAAVVLQVPQDWGLLASGASMLLLLPRRAEAGAAHPA